jgi:hypothetical protein
MANVAQTQLKAITAQSFGFINSELVIIIADPPKDSPL